MSKIISALDIGTSSIKILIGRQKNKGQNVEILTKAQVPSFGVRKGEINKPDKTAENISQILSEIQKKSGLKVKNCLSNINGAHLFTTASQGLVSVSRADKKISEEDINRVLHQAEAINLPSNKEILDVFPKEFIIDDQGGIKEPLGLLGIRLEAKVILLCGFSPFLENLNQALSLANIVANEAIPSPLADSFSCLSLKEKELGVALVDIGAETTGLVVFEDGDVINLSVFPFGSANITNDIAIGLRTEIETAEEIKKEFATLSANKKKNKKKEERGKIVIPEKALSFSRKTLSRIVEARISEIFNEVSKELKRISKQELLPAGVVLTGGGSNLEGIVEYAKEKLKLPARLAKFRNLSGLPIVELSYSVAAGLLLKSLFEKETEKSKNFGKGFRKFFRIFLP